MKKKKLLLLLSLAMLGVAGTQLLNESSVIVNAASKGVTTSEDGLTKTIDIQSYDSAFSVPKSSYYYDEEDGILYHNLHASSAWTQNGLKFINMDIYFEVPRDAAGSMTITCDGSNTSRWMYFIKDGAALSDNNRRFAYAGSGKTAVQDFTADDIEELHFDSDNNLVTDDSYTTTRYFVGLTAAGNDYKVRKFEINLTQGNFNDQPSEEDYVYAETVKIDQESFTWDLLKNPEVQLSATYGRNDDEEINILPTLTWSAEGDSVAVDSKGVLSCIGKGESTVSVTMSYKGTDIEVTDSITVTVEDHIKVEEEEVASFSITDHADWIKGQENWPGKDSKGEFWSDKVFNVFDDGENSVKFYCDGVETQWKESSQTFNGVKYDYAIQGPKIEVDENGLPAAGEKGLMIELSERYTLEIYGRNSNSSSARHLSLMKYDEKSATEVATVAMGGNENVILVGENLEPGKYYVQCTGDSDGKPTAFNFYGGKLKCPQQIAYVKAGYQISQTEDRNDLRLVGGINADINLSRVEYFGFELTNGTQTVKRYTTVALTTLMINGEEVAASSEGLVYMFAYIIEGVTEENVSTFQFRSYVKMLSGETVYSSVNYITPTLG